jgi:hypothetical protein
MRGLIAEVVLGLALCVAEVALRVADWLQGKAVEGRTMKLALVMVAAAMPAMAQESSPALKVTLMPWVETAISALTEPGSKTTVGGNLRFDGIVPISEKQDAETARFRVDLNIVGNASTTTQVLDLAAPATWGRYSEVTIAVFSKINRAQGATLSWYVSAGFQTAFGDRNKVLERFFHNYQAGVRLSSGPYEIVIAPTYDTRLEGFGVAIHGRTPIPGSSGRVAFLMGDAILGSKGADQYLLRVGLDLGEVITAVGKKP